MADFWKKFKALIRGERLERPKRPEPVRRVCYACRQPILGYGYLYADRMFCDSLCVPPFLIDERARQIQAARAHAYKELVKATFGEEEREIPDFAGEPGR